MKQWQGIALAALCALAAAGARAELDLDLGMGDARVKRAFEEEGLRYRIDDEGIFILTFEGVDEDRTQLVFAMSSTERLGEAEIREIISVAYRGKPISKSQMAELLAENARFKIGAWEAPPPVADEDNNRVQTVRFCARIDAAAPAAVLRRVIEHVSDTADAKERDWMGSDDF